MKELVESATLVVITPNMSLAKHYNNSAADCFNSSGDGAEVNAYMLREMKAFSPYLLVFYCIINMSLGLLSCVGNALVVLTVVSFSELHTVTNIGLACLSTTTFLNGSILHSFLCAIGFNVLVNNCPLFQRKVVYAVFYLIHVFLYNFLLNLCLVTAERYIGVVLCLRYHCLLPKQRVLKLFALSWIASFLLSTPHSMDSSFWQSFAKATWIFTVFFALTFSFYCNVRMFRIARQHKRRINNRVDVSEQTTVVNQDRFRGARTVFYVLVTLLACYVPELVVRVLRSSMDKDEIGTLALIRPWTSTFYVMYSSINPFVYFFRSRRLRSYSTKLIRKVQRLMREHFLKLTVTSVEEINLTLPVTVLAQNYRATSMTHMQSVV